MPVQTRSDPYENATNIYNGPICHDPGFTGFGSLTSGVVFLGIAPGRDEMKTGKPFTGPSGQLLNSYLRSIGLERENVYCTNLICWWKDDPSYQEFLNCKPRLMAELRAIKPKLIVLMGAPVTEYMIGKKLAGTRGARGSVTWCTAFPELANLNCYIMPTYHPAAVLHGSGKEAASGDKGADVALDIWRDLSKIKDVLTWPNNDSLMHVPYDVVTSSEQAQRILDNLPPKSSGIPVAVDVETSSPDEDEMDFTSDQLLCLSIATPDFSWVFPRAVLDGLTWPIDNVAWTFHNGLFDTQIIFEHLGFWLPVVEDTMLQSYSLDERPGKHRLKPLAREYIGAGWWELDRQKVAGKLHTLPPDVLYRYNAFDGGNTARLCVKLRPRQNSDDVREMYESILIPAVNVFNRIQYRGVRVDKYTLFQYTIKFGKIVEQRKKRLIKMARDYGWPESELGPINVNSPAKLSIMLYGVLSLPLAPYGKKRDSTDKTNLERLAGMHPFVDALANYRKWEHNYNIYIEKMREHIKRDGRAHAVVKLHGTMTGRLSYTKPPLQTIPRPYDSDEDWARAFRNLRRLFIPDDPSHIVIEADLGKAEIWMAHYYSGDPQLRTDLLSGDYHTAVSMGVLKKQKDQVTKDDRFEMKRVTFGIMYGREAKSLARAIKRTVFEASVYIRDFFERNNVYSRFLQQMQETAMREGELRTVTKRKRRFMFMGADWDHRALKQAVNYPIQSTTSDYTLMSVVELFHELAKYGAYIMVSVHDSIVVGCPRGSAEAVVRLIHEVMTRPRWFDVLPVEIKAGPNWGDTRPVHSCEDANSCQDARRDHKYHEPVFDFTEVDKLLSEQAHRDTESEAKIIEMIDQLYKDGTAHAS